MAPLILAAGVSRAALGVESLGEGRQGVRRCAAAAENTRGGEAVAPGQDGQLAYTPVRQAGFRAFPSWRSIPAFVPSWRSILERITLAHRPLGGRHLAPVPESGSLLRRCWVDAVSAVLGARCDSKKTMGREPIGAGRNPKIENKKRGNKRKEMAPASILPS